jgi:hypothetical protein
MKPLIIFSLLLLSACSTIDKSKAVDTSSISVGSVQCGSTPSAKIELERLGERLQASALMQITPIETVIVSFYARRSGDKDWTVMIDGKNGRSCMILWGKHWLVAGQES